MPYCVYIIQSEKDDSYYIGSTGNIDERINKHNLGHSRYTKSKTPWNLVYREDFQDKSSALKREYYLKKKKSKHFISSLIRDILTI